MRCAALRYAMLARTLGVTGGSRIATVHNLKQQFVPLCGMAVCYLPDLSTLTYKPKHSPR